MAAHRDVTGTIANDVTMACSYAYLCINIHDGNHWKKGNQLQLIFCASVMKNPGFCGISPMDSEFLWPKNVFEKNIL